MAARVCERCGKPSVEKVTDLDGVTYDKYCAKCNRDVTNFWVRGKSPMFGKGVRKALRTPSAMAR